MPLETIYNKIYSGNENVFGNGKPEKVVRDILKYVTTGTALELGAGQGRNSLFLANHGFNVTALDLSEVGVNLINRVAQEKGLSVKAEVADIKVLKPGFNFDVLVCTYVLHHLTRSEALDLIKQMQKQTTVGGLNAIAVFSEDGDFYRKDPTTQNFFLKVGELRDLYADWEILKYEEVDGKAVAKKPDGSFMRNVSARILARKIT